MQGVSKACCSIKARVENARSRNALDRVFKAGMWNIPNSLIGAQRTKLFETSGMYREASMLLHTHTPQEPPGRS